MLDSEQDSAQRSRARRGIAVLLLVAALTGESIASANTPVVALMRNPLLLLYFVGAYGAPALLLREAWVRRRIGVPGALGAALAYTAFNEGVVADTWFSHDALAASFNTFALGRIAGINLTLVAGLVIFHTFLSLAVPIAVVEVAQSGAPQPWLRRRGVIVAAFVVAFIAVGSVAPKHGVAVADVGARVGAIAFIVGCLVVAGVLPRTRPTRSQSTSASPLRRLTRRRVWAMGAAVAFGFFVAFFLGARLLGVFDIGPLVLAGGCALALACQSGTRPDWSPRHTIALIAGAMTPSLVVDASLVPLLQPVAAVAAVTTLVVLDRRARRVSQRPQG